MKPTSNWMTQEQFILLLADIPRLKIRKWKDDDVRMLFKICYWLALRIGEGLRLSVDDFDLDLMYVYLGKTKTTYNDKRIIPVAFIPELKSYLHTRSGDLFHGMKYDSVYGWLIRLGKMLDIKALTTKQSESKEKTKTHIFRKSRGKDMYFGTLTGHRADII